VTRTGETDRMVLLGLAPGNWAEWVGGVGTALAFGATSVAIWQNHRLHRVQHGEEMFDQALLVTTDIGQGTHYEIVTKPDGSTEKQSVNRTVVTVRNGSRRQISNVSVQLWTLEPVLVGGDSVDFIQAKWDQPFYFPPIDGLGGSFTTEPGVQAQATLTFEDIDGTKWTRSWAGRLVRYQRLRVIRSDGRRHARKPRDHP
jgi:hypothetical protein